MHNSLRQRDTHHTPRARESVSERREKDTLSSRRPPHVLRHYPAHLLASPHASLLLSPKHVGAPFSLRTWNFLFNENLKKKRTKKEKNANIF